MVYGWCPSVSEVKKKLLWIFLTRKKETNKYTCLHFCPCLISAFVVTVVAFLLMFSFEFLLTSAVWISTEGTHLWLQCHWNLVLPQSNDKYQFYTLYSHTNEDDVCLVLNEKQFYRPIQVISVSCYLLFVVLRKCRLNVRPILSLSLSHNTVCCQRQKIFSYLYY